MLFFTFAREVYDIYVGFRCVFASKSPQGLEARSQVRINNKD